MYSIIHRNSNDSRSRDGTSSLKPAVFQTYGQPVTSDAYHNSRQAATVSVPRSQGRTTKYYPEIVGSGHTRRGAEYASNQSVSSASKVAGRRDPATRLEESGRLGNYPDRRDKVTAGSRRGDMQEDDSGSDVKGFLGARKREDQEIPQRRGSARQSRHDADACQYVRHPPDQKRISTGSVSRSYDNATGHQNYDHRKPEKAAVSFDKASRHTGDTLGQDDRHQHTGSAIADRKHSTSDGRPGRVSYRDEHAQDEDSASDIRGAYGHGVRRHSSPPPRRYTDDVPGKDKYALNRQSTRQAHAAMTSGAHRHDTHSQDHHTKFLGTYAANEKRSRDTATEKGRPDRHGSDRFVAQQTRHDTRGDRPKPETRHAYRWGGSASDSDDLHRNAAIKSKNASRPSAGRHGSYEDDKVPDSLNKTFTALRLRRISGGDDDDDDDIKGGFGSRSTGPKSSRHAPGSGRPPRPRPGEDDDDIVGTYGSRHA